MKGFVPVSKNSLLEMLAECREETAMQFEAETADRIAYLIKQEKERMTTRRWYRLWILPKARFAFDDESVKEYSANMDYPLFDADPFHSVEQDANNSLQWIDRLERVALSEHSGEPIQLDMKTFMRISQPARYYWATCGSFYTLDR